MSEPPGEPDQDDLAPSLRNFAFHARRFLDNARFSAHRRPLTTAAGAVIVRLTLDGAQWAIFEWANITERLPDARDWLTHAPIDGLDVSLGALVFPGFLGFSDPFLELLSQWGFKPAWVIINNRNLKQRLLAPQELPEFPLPI